MPDISRTFRRLAAAVAAGAAVAMLAPAAKADNYACLFYFPGYGDTLYTPSDEISPAGDSWIMQGQNPAYGPPGTLSWWGKPLWAATHGDGTIVNNYRFYSNGDPTQTNNALLDYHADLISRAGVDFVVLDFTNGAQDFFAGPSYVSGTKALLNRWQARLAAGLPTPKVVFFAYNEDTLNTIQSTFFANYNPNLFFNYLGKKLVLVAKPNMSLGQGDPGQPAIPTSGAFANYTCRHAWALDTSGSCWQFKEDATTPPPAFMYNGTPEQMCVPVSCGGTSDGVNLLPNAQGRQDGAFFNKYMTAAQQVKPTFTFLHSWNEWNARNGGTQANPQFIDQWLTEWSSDIEPMAGGHGYQYYDLAAQQVARLKGNFPVISGQSYMLLNENSNMALDVPNGTNVHGTQLQQWTPNGATAQAWKFTDLGDGYWELINVASGLALDDYGWGTANGTVVDQWDASASPVTNAQQWSLRPAGDGSWKVVNRNSGRTLAISGASTSAGAKTILWDDNGTTDHNWFLMPYIADGSYKIVATTTGNALDVANLNNGALAQLHSYASGANQKWSIHNLGNGSFSIRNANGRSLDCTGCSSANGTQTELYDYWGGPCQQWKIVPVGGGVYRIVTAQAKADGTCDVLDGAGCSGTSGTNVLLWSWNGGGCQQTWYIQPAN
ncbi:hypothetical protein CCAX7_32680 [Capsulimonas corticalis]|uniref:Ricin B lectin domain-containing protein n=1 Tax=Capsulimonas corticalis TaxID=2219043 RepID=A0A402D7A4_9BACT|nr:RICIN domain-containing protein [Capsulimonas corticalis]BDI31217.1 hypothetical protein CCAX7_32680 [Capsulimonas corticalis]